jgi:RimJ/RimL family protein N-acetyltransferase
MPVDAAFASFPVVSTDRFHPRQIRSGDAEAFFRLKSDLEVTSSYGQEPHQSLQETQAWVQCLQGAYARREAIVWAITFKGQDLPIGSCTYWHFDAGFHCGEIDYELNRAYWGQGIVSEVLPTVISYGFKELGLNRIEANPFGRNARSSKILLKLGFAHEGTLRQRHFFRGCYEDQLYFGLLKEEWL